MAMEDSSFLQRGLNVGLRPGIALWNSLTTMREMVDSAVLNVTKGRVQILANTIDNVTYVTLEMKSVLTDTSWECSSFALHIDLATWIPRLGNPILQHKAGQVLIKKMPGSPFLHCLIGNNPLPIILGEAQFVQPNEVNVNNFHCRLRVNMRTQCWRDFDRTFVPNYEQVMLIVFNGSLYWRIPSMRINHFAGYCTIGGSDAGKAVRIWIWPFFQVLMSASRWCEYIVISIFTDDQGTNWLHFRFLFGTRSSFSYIDRGVREPKHNHLLMARLVNGSCHRRVANSIRRMTNGGLSGR
ncbi:hypothetical protein V2J09_003243 [Rumex salicifolius]